jgi:hypothetical protein
MGRLPYDILRLLAHGAISTGGQILGEMITQPMKEKSAGKQQMLKTALGGASTLPEEGMKSLNDWLQQNYGRSFPTYQAPTGNIMTPGGEKLGMTPTPEALQSGAVSPEMVQKIVRPETNLNQVLAHAMQGDRSLIDAYAGKISGRDLTAAQKAADEVARTKMDFGQQVKMMELQNKEALLPHMIGKLQAEADAKIASIENARLKGQLEEKKYNLGEKDKTEKAMETKRAHRENELVKYLNIIKNPDADPAARYEAAQTYNGMIKNMPPELAPWMKHHTPFELKPPEKKTFLGFDTGMTKPEVGIGGNIGTPAPITLEESGGPKQGGGLDPIAELKNRAKAGDKAAQGYLQKKGESWQ